MPETNVSSGSGEPTGNLKNNLPRNRNTGQPTRASCRQPVHCELTSRAQVLEYLNSTRHEGPILGNARTPVLGYQGSQTVDGLGRSSESVTNKQVPTKELTHRASLPLTLTSPAELDIDTLHAGQGQPSRCTHQTPLLCPTSRNGKRGGLVRLDS